MHALKRVLPALLPAVLLAAPSLSISDWAAVGRSSGRLKVVALLPLTGPAVSLGMFLRYGIELGRRELAESGEGGADVDVLYLDTMSEPEGGAAAIQAVLAKGRPDAVICALSSVSRAVIPFLEREGILTVVTAADGPDLTKGTKHVVRLYPGARDNLGPVANYMLLRFDNIAALYIDEDSGREDQRMLAKMVGDAGKTLSAAEPFESRAVDIRPAIDRVLASSPDAVFVTGYGRALVSAIRQLRELAGGMPIFSEANFGNPTVLKALGEAADGIVFDGTDLELSVSADKRTEQFRRLYRETFRTDPYHLVGFAHDSILLLAEAARKAGGKPDKAALTSLSHFKGVMGGIFLDPEGESRISLRLILRQKGRNVPLES